MVGFLLDTCVVSETSKLESDDGVMRFLATEGDIALPMGAIIEFEMGIRRKHAEDPAKAKRLLAWLDGLLATGMPVVETGVAIARQYGMMRASKTLSHLFITQSNAKVVRGGQDVHNAAAAIVSGRSMVTFDVIDYLSIHAEYPMPGIYDPKLDHWHVRPGDRTVHHPRHGLIPLKTPFSGARTRR